LASPYVAPDLARLDELERITRAVAEEIAGWRRRSLSAESELEELGARTGVGAYGSGDIAQVRQRTADLEAENRELKRRIAVAREQIEQLRTRLRFVDERVTGAGGSRG
jgi:hypothetical protein